MISEYWTGIFVQNSIIYVQNTMHRNDLSISMNKILLIIFNYFIYFAQKNYNIAFYV